jgi:hypothetical protein
MDPESQYQQALAHQQVLLGHAANHHDGSSSPSREARGWLARRLHRLANHLEPPAPRCELDVLRAVSRGELSVDQALPLLNGS